MPIYRSIRSIICRCDSKRQSISLLNSVSYLHCSAKKNMLHRIALLSALLLSSCNRNVPVTEAVKERQPEASRIEGLKITTGGWEPGNPTHAVFYVENETGKDVLFWEEVIVEIEGSEPPFETALLEHGERALIPCDIDGYWDVRIPTPFDVAWRARFKISLLDAKMDDDIDGDIDYPAVYVLSPKVPSLSD